ncbi:hypothetical protein BsWGS_01460 [Bradybaena similaris]
MGSDQVRNIKVVLVGDIYVGKTSLANVFVSNYFREKYVSSVGAHFTAKTLEKPRVTLQIWDTAGMERFRCLLPHFMRGAECAFIVYDVSNRDTFSSVCDYWVDYVEAASTRPLTKVLVANKSDSLVKSVKEYEGRRFAESHNMLFFETSAKFSINVDKLFTDAATAVIETTPEPVENPDNGVKLETSGQKKSKCCLSS